jgi:copper chaperone CopZ
MRISRGVVGLAFASVLFVGCKNTDRKPTEVSGENLNQVQIKKEIAAATKPETATFHIEGMTCAVGCAKTIEEKLAEMEGVQNAKVDFETKTATVNFDLDKLKSDDLVKAAESCADGKTYKVSDVKLGNKA